MKKEDSKKKTEAIQKLKSKVAEQANKLIAKAFKNTVNDLDKLLKANGFWYCDGDVIKDTEVMQMVKDRNCDQMVIDHFTTINDDMFRHVDDSMLWTKADISA